MKRKQTKARGKFTDETRAQIFEWDHAVCAFTGASLWILDYGACSQFHEDWMDHIKPVARGGSHSATNGMCASEIANSIKGANGRANLYWFAGGRPTCHLFEAIGMVPKETARLLRRDVQRRDWYLNHCFRNLVWRVNNLANGSDDHRHTQRPGYYSGAAYRFLQQYKSYWSREMEQPYSAEAARRDLRARRLAPARPSDDQIRMLDVLGAESPEAIESVAQDLIECYRVSDKWLIEMDAWTKSCDIASGEVILKAMGRDRRVSPLAKRIVAHNINVLGGLPRPVRGEGVRKIIRRW